MKIKYFDGEEIRDDYNRRQIVYHYTSPDNFLSILENKKIRFSDIQFMNDRSEYVYIREILESVIKKRSKKSYNDKFIDYILGPPYRGVLPKKQVEKNYYKGLVMTRYYIFCASLDSDNHSLWNYYVKNNNYQGYNIGINTNALIKAIQENLPVTPNWRVIHGRVNYNRQTQIEKLNLKIEELESEFNKRMHKGMDEDKNIECYQDELGEYLSERCLFYKNPVFAHENEYRFIVETSAQDKGLRFYVNSTGMIVPHLEIQFEPANIMKNITLSPILEKEVTKQGVKNLLVSVTGKQGDEIPICFSKIDIRY